MQVSILKKNKPLPQYQHKGNTYVEADRGRYKIRLYNDSSERKLAVVSIDGINIISGEDASFEGQGYVLGPWQTAVVKGWAREDGKAAAFKFCPEGGSYASLTGRGVGNVGVIGVAVFNEKAPIKIDIPHTYTYIPEPEPTSWTRRPRIWLSDNTRGIPTAYTASSNVGSPSVGAQDLGTGYGKEVDFQTSHTLFTRESETPSEVVVLQYATRERLSSWGVLQSPPTPPAPNPFPARSTGVPAPPGWVG